MTDRPEPVGELFTKLYLRPAKLLPDSKKFRVRLASYFVQSLDKYHGSAFAQTLQVIGGITPPQSGFGYDLYGFFIDSPIGELLDGITILWRTLIAQKYGDEQKWLNFVAQVLEEEGIGYRVDGRCGVHHKVDAEFERNRSSTINGLGAPRYSAVKTALENAYSKLDKTPLDSKGVIRDVFEAVEIVSKLIGATHQDLDAKFVKAIIKPLAQKTFKTQHESQMAFTDQLLEGLADWVNAGHKYRHGQKTEDPVAPSASMAIGYLSIGATYIRLLVELDGLANPG